MRKLNTGPVGALYAKRWLRFLLMPVVGTVAGVVLCVVMALLYRAVRGYPVTLPIRDVPPLILIVAGVVIFPGLPVMIVVLRFRGTRLAAVVANVAVMVFLIGMLMLAARSDIKDFPPGQMKAAAPALVALCLIAAGIMASSWTFAFPKRFETEARRQTIVNTF